MHQLVPPFILHNYADGKTTGSLQAAGLFVDTSGFSAMTDALMMHGQHGAEVLADVMGATFEPLVRSVFEQGGFVTSQEGDALTALFPIETSVEDSALHALTAAWQIQQSVSQQGTFLTPYGEFSIVVKVGLSMGEARWGIFTSAKQHRATYYFRGPVVEDCVEAEHQAQAGEILLSNGMYQEVLHLVTAEAKGNQFRLISLLQPAPLPLQITLPEPDLSLASRFFPRQILVKKKNNPPRGEFRQVAYLFVSLANIRDEAQLNLFMQAVFQLQDQYGGLLKLMFGDKGAHLVLVWGAPVANENDIERALNFILDLQSRTTMPINGGIAYRIAHTGYIGSDLAEDFSAFGRGANLAARFMTSSPRGQIWVDENIYRRARRLFNLEYIGEQNFKGFSHPQKVFVLLDRKDEDEIFFDGVYSGREKELSALHAFIRPIFWGKFPGMLVIWGEPGMGKSRLAHEFIHQLEKDPAQHLQVIYCQADEILRQPLNPFRYWLRHYFQVSSAQDEARNKRSFNRKLNELISTTRDSQLADEIDRTRSFLGALLDLRWADSLYEQVDAKIRYENTLLALESLLKAESCRQPLLLLLEDVHWFDEETKALLPRLLRLFGSDQDTACPIAILATARLEGSGLPLEGLEYQEMQLQPLDRAGLAGLAQSILNDPLLPESPSISNSLVDLLQERSEGNPFFAGQILYFLREEGLLDQQAAWEVKPAHSLSLPAEVDALLVARLDRLAEEVKDTVQTASVIGREFELKLLACMMDEKKTEQILPEVNAAERESIWMKGPGTHYIFKHALMREAAYQMQLHTRRQELHAQAVTAYEKIFGASLPDYYGELAYHTDQAGQAVKACHYLTLAGQAAKAAYQNGLAARYFFRALELTPREETTHRFELLLECEAVNTLRGSGEERRRDLTELEKLASETNDPQCRQLALVRQASYTLDTGLYPEASTLALHAANLALTNGNNSLAAQAFHLLAIASLRQGKLSQAENEATKGLEIARLAKDHPTQSSLLNLLGMIALGQEKLDRAAASFEQGLQTARETGILRDQAQALNNLGMLAGMQGNLSESEQYYEQALGLARKIGDQPGEGLVLGNLGFIAGNLGDYRKAVDFTGQYLRISRKVGDLMSECYAQINLSAYASAMGDLNTAIQSAKNSLVLAKQTGDRSAEAWSLTYLGHSLLSQNNPEEASQAYQAAIEIRSGLEQAVLAVEPGAGLAQAALQRGQSEDAQLMIQPVLAQIESDPSLAGTDDPLRVYLTCFLVLTHSGDPRTRNLIETAYASLQSRAASVADPVMRRSFLEDIPHHRQILQAWTEYQLTSPNQPGDRRDPVVQ